MAATLNPIRTSVAPYAPQVAQPQDAAKLAAAKAFFAAALGQVSTPTRAVESGATTSAAVQPTLAAPVDAPQKFPRPGSLIDIRV